MKTEIPALDGLRGAAALMVVVAHASQYFVPESWWGNIGSSGVLVFFALSGFLMAYLHTGEPITAEHD